MGKKYLDTKKDSLESSVLEVWQTAIEEGDVRMDGRTKGYKSHRSKLETARQRREEKKVNKEKVEVDEGTWALPKTPKEKAALKKLLSKPLPAGAAVDKLYDILGDDELADNIDDFEKDMGPKADVRNLVRDRMKELGIKEEVELEEATGDKEEYQKFFRKAMKKFGVTEPDQLKGDKRKEFYNYVDKNWTGDHEESFEYVKEFKVQSMKAALAQVWGIEEGKKDDVDLEEWKTLNANRRVSGGDKRRSENKNKKGSEIAEEDVTWENAQRFKIESMKAALAQVWGIEEGHNPFAEHKGTKPHKHPHDEEHDDEENKKRTKTETGKKPAAIDLKPKIDDR